MNYEQNNEKKQVHDFWNEAVCGMWSRWFIRRFLPDAGLFMLIEARK